MQPVHRAQLDQLAHQEPLELLEQAAHKDHKDRVDHKDLPELLVLEQQVLVD